MSGGSLVTWSGTTVVVLDHYKYVRLHASRGTARVEVESEAAEHELLTNGDSADTTQWQQPAETGRVWRSWICRVYVAREKPQRSNVPKLLELHRWTRRVRPPGTATTATPPPQFASAEFCNYKYVYVSPFLGAIRDVKG